MRDDTYIVTNSKKVSFLGRDKPTLGSHLINVILNKKISNLPIVMIN